MSNSDYTKNNTNFYDLLPTVYQNDYTKSLFNNLFNRYITKDELTHVDGYIGDGNPNALINRNIKEFSAHRQAFQLQPMLYSKVGTIEHMATWKDILNEMEKVGIDTLKLKEWLTPQKFNWVPPIDIDKLLHYQDYYWYNPEKPNDIPQYITIKNSCTISDSKVKLYQKIINSNGDLFLIVDINSTDNSFTLASDKSNIFSKDSIFYTKGATNNSDINNSFWTVISAAYDSQSDKTVIEVVENITDDTISGNISLSEFLDILTDERDCICNGSIGFDKTLFDDNQLGSIIWNNDLKNDTTHTTLAQWLLVNIDLSVYDLWIDSSTDTLKQFSQAQADINGTTFTDDSNWVIVKQNISIILDRTEGEHFFDLTIDCTYPRNEWVDQNFWVHKSVIPNFSIAKQAEVPIIEFSQFLELNEWVCKIHKWYYRENKFSPFELSDKKPSLFELVDIDTYNLKPNIIELDSKYGDLSDTFNPDYKFNILNSEGAVYQLSNLTTGFAGTFTVIGDITSQYTDVNDLVNPNQLPSQLKIRNSPSALLDQVWTIDNIDIISSPGKSIITIIVSESINTFSFAGAEIFLTNTGLYTNQYSTFEKVKTSFPITNIDLNTNSITITGDITLSTGFSDYFYTNQGVYAYTILTPFNGTSTVLLIAEIIPVIFNSNEIFIEEFKTVLRIQESFNLYHNDSSILSPIETSNGHIWDSYNTHWVYNGIETISPINRRNLIPGVNLDVPIQINDFEYGVNSTYDTNDFEYKVNKYVQQFLVKKSVGLSRFELHESLINIALIGTDNIRVYVKTISDNRFIRQYGNYTEIDTLGFVSGIEFDILSPLLTYTEIKIEVGPTTIEDIGFSNINVRTEFSDEIYDANPILNSEFTDLQQFFKHEQVKTETNQYPLFDLYDTSGNPLKIVSEIFKFKESADADITFVVNRRIVKDGTDFTFEQGLVSETNGELYTYRDNKVPHLNYFVNSFDNSVLIWNNFTWNTKILTDSKYLVPIIANTEPTEIFETFAGQIWYNPDTKLLMRHDGTSFNSIAFDFGTIDPTLKTIWQPGSNDEQYEPKYVDENKAEITIGSDLGDWEIPDPLYYNVHHENRKEITLVYLTAHFNTIINSQEFIPGFSAAPNDTFHINTNPNFGIGGTIREYNDGLDILLSSIFLDTVTTRKLLDFAQNQYSFSLISLTEELIKNVKTDFINTTIFNVDNLFDKTIENIIKSYELNDANALIYSDSPMYSNSLGIKNWIATLPQLGFSEKTIPYILDKSQHLVKHHDGHISENSLVNNVKENIIVTILKTEDVRTGAGETFGNTFQQFNQAVPSTLSDLLTAFNSINLVNGKYWYSRQGSSRILYRLNLAVVSNTMPNSNYIDGSKWYDISTDTLYEITTGTWNIITALGDGIIATAWEEINFDSLNTNLILTLEEKLYEVLVPTEQKLDYSIIQANSNFTKFEHEAFNEHIKNIDVINPLSQLGIYNPLDAFSWNYIKSNLVDLPYIGSQSGTTIGGCWQDLYEKVYGTAYPHLEPWKLQGYIDKPIWWDSEYKDLTSTRLWIYNHATNTGMWDNILKGIVPVGYSLSNGIVSTGAGGEAQVYVYLPVMIDDNIIETFSPDEILPPFWDHTGHFGNSYNGPIRTLFSDFNSEIIQPNLDFKFGDKGTREWIWNNSVEYNYDLMKIYFRIDPLDFYNNSFGINYNIINDLQINRDTNKVYSHVDTVFHGEIFNNNKLFEINGVNQWYSNYNRYFNIDNYSSTFNSLWTKWTTPLTYQFASFIDTESFDIQNRNFDLVDSDLSITMKKSKAIKESWIDALNVSVEKIPNIKLAHNTDYKWSFNIFTNIARNIKYYDIKKFPVDLENNILTLYKFEIININSTDNTLTIAGNWEHIKNDFNITGSTNNDNTYTLDDSIYDRSLDTTIIKPNEILVDTIIDGFIENNYRISDWETGQAVIFESTESLPRPLNVNQTYFAIKVTNNQFKLADTRVDAENNNHIILDELSSGQFFIGQIDKTFNAISNINSNKNWLDYTIDKSNTLEFNSNKNIYGIQHVVDIVNGFSSLLEDDGWQFNYDSIEIDPILGRPIGWQLEIEKFINELFVIQKTKQHINDTHNFTSTAGLMEFQAFNPSWVTGTKVLLTSTTTLPSPLFSNTPYYIIRHENANEFSLASSVTDAHQNNIITILNDGNISLIEEYNVAKSIYIFELNPFRNNIWYNNKLGIISDINKGPFNDINVDYTIYDQNNNLLDSNKVSIYREDSLSKILLQDPVINVNNLHISGFHLFVDGYEHVLLFNNYTSDDFLIYDPYIGLNTAKFDLIFDKQSLLSLRPNIGGKFLINKNEFVSNLESLTKNLENAYSTYSTSEFDEMTNLSRVGVGYDRSEQTFLDNLELNDKSQFIFWKGLIQHKGSVNAINAFINSRRFVDAKLDEYWAYKLADYGDAKTKIYPELKISPDNTLSNELKLEFIEEGQTPDENFIPVLLNDENQWFEYYNQKAVLDSIYKSHFYFNAEITEVYPNDRATLTINDSLLNQEGALWFTNNSWYFKTDKLFDSVIISYESIIIDYLVEGIDFEIVNSSIIKFVNDPRIYPNIKINILNVAKSKHSPLKIIDYKSDIKLLDMPIWNPAKGHQYHLSEHFINIRRNDNPAEYTNFLNTSLSGNELDAWKSEHLNTTWLDNTLLDYYPYHDNRIEPSTIDRIRKWGQLADYAQFELYQWTESELHPNEWNDIAIFEELDKTISDQIRKTGRVQELVYNPTTDSYEKSYKYFEEYHAIDRTLIHPIEIITFNSIEQENIDLYIEEIKPKFNIKGYINGIETYQVKFSSVIGTDDSTITIELIFDSADEKDLKTIVWFAYDEIDGTGVRIYPTVEDIDKGEYVIDTPYTSVITKNLDKTDKIKYFFWVKNKTIKIDGLLSLNEIKQDMINIPIPFAIIQNYLQNKSIIPIGATVDPLNDNIIDLASGDKEIIKRLPNRYNQLVIKGLSKKINDEDRYKIKFIHDFTLRDNIEDGNTNINLKTTHQEWKLFREKQQFHIDRWLWDRVIESILGRTLIGNNRIPLLDKELYDIENSTDTRYGLNPGQLFIDRQLAIDAIFADLFNPEFDFYPIDIDSFIQTNNFDTEENSIQFLNELYNKFSSEHLNRIFFSILHIALSKKIEYDNLMKTSMISLHGIRILETNGEFDD